MINYYPSPSADTPRLRSEPYTDVVLNELNEIYHRFSVLLLILLMKLICWLSYLGWLANFLLAFVTERKYEINKWHGGWGGGMGLQGIFESTVMQDTNSPHLLFSKDIWVCLGEYELFRIGWKSKGDQLTNQLTCWTEVVDRLYILMEVIRVFFRSLTHDHVLSLYGSVSDMRRSVWSRRRGANWRGRRSQTRQKQRKPGRSC